MKYTPADGGCMAGVVMIVREKVDEDGINSKAFIGISTKGDSTAAALPAENITAEAPLPLKGFGFTISIQRL